MTGRQTDVTMVIKAKEEAGKAILTVADAIKTLTGAQDKLASSGGATSSLLEQLKVASTALASAVQKTDSAVDKAAAAFEKQQKTLAETEASLVAVKTQMAAAERAVAGLNAAIAKGDKDIGVYRVQLAGVTAEQKNLNAQAKQLTSSITTQQAALSKSAATLAQMQSAGRTAGSAATFALVTPKTVADTNQAATATRRLASSLPPIAPAARDGAAGVDSLRGAFSRLLATLTKVPDAASRAEATMASYGGHSNSLFGRLATQVRYIAGYALIFKAIGEVPRVLNAYQDLQAAQNRLLVAFDGDTRKVAADINWLREQSVRLGVSFSTLSGEYSKFAIAAQFANFTSENTRRIFLSVAEAGRVSQLSTEQLSGVFLALTQMMSKGKILSEELRRQLGDRLSGAFQLFADALGVSTAKLDKMMSKGEVFANETNLGKIADELTEKYGPQLGKALQSTAAQIGRFQALLEQREITLAKGGFIAALNDGLKSLNDFFQSKEGETFFSRIGTALGRLVQVVQIAARNFDLISIAFRAWLTVRVGQFLVDLYARLGRTSAATEMLRARVLNVTAALVLLGSTASGPARVAISALGAAMVSLQGILLRTAAVARGFWVALGGFPGLILTGLSFVVTSLAGKWLTGVDAANEALNEHERILDKVKEGYDAAGGKVDEWAKKIKEVSTIEIRANIAQLEEQLEAARKHAGDIVLGAMPGDVLNNPLFPLVKQFEAGAISAEKFKSEIVRFGESHPQLTQLIADVLAVVREVGKLEAGIKENAAGLRVLTGRATEADVALLGLGDAFEKSGRKAAGALDAFTTALDTMRKQVPDLKRQSAFQDKFDAAKQGFDAAIQAATTPAQKAEAKRVYDQVVQSLRAYAAADAAKAFPVDNKAIIERIIYVESNGNITAKNPNSSAYGVGQFTSATWLRLFDQVFPALADMAKEAKLALRSNADTSRRVLEAFTQQNQFALAQAGVPVTGANTYLAHFLGASGAIKMILANPDELASKIAGASATKANPSILGGGKTVGDVLNWANLKMGGPSPILSTGETQIEKVTADLQAQIQAWNDEADAIREANALTVRLGDGAERALFIQKAISSETKKFADAGGFITPKQVSDIREAAGALFDLQHQQQSAQKIVEQIVGLSEQRATAIQELHNAFSDGSPTEEVDALKRKVDELTAALERVLPAAQAMAASLGNEKMVATLENANKQLQTLKVGLTDANQMNTLIADSVVTAWGNFNSTLGQTRNVFVALRRALLQFALDFVTKIEEMILKQQVLNALSGTGIGKFLSGAVNDATGTGPAALNTSSSLAATAVSSLAAAATAATVALQEMSLSAAFSQVGGEDAFLDNALTFLGEFHEGGIVGRDGRSRAVSAAIFAGAQRFHGGGLPGLRRGEVPAILERGEEVLRRNDPRHALNGGGIASREPVVKLKNVNVFDHGEVLSQALNTEVGEKALLNFVGQRRSAFRAALG